MKTFSILILLFVALLAFQAGTLAAETHCEETRAARQAARDNEVKARADWIVARARYNAAIMSYLSGSPSVRKVDGAQRRIDIENAYNASIAAYQAAYRAWRAADIAHDECLLRFRCANGCGAAVDYVTQHLVDPQPECSHRWGVYSCSPSGGSRHTQLVCSACNKTYWKCGSHNHVQLTCPGCNSTYWKCTSAGNHTRMLCISGRHAVGSIGSYTSTAWITGCGQYYYYCQSSAHRMVKISGHMPRRACMISGSSSSSSGSGSGSSSGSGSGDSSNRVRCGYSRCDKGGYASSRTAHQAVCTFPTHSRPITYWTCWPASRRYHTSSPSHSQPILTCRRCGTTFVQSRNGPCRHRGRRYSSHSGG